MANIDLKEYARRGATARLAELKAELETIYETFPDLRRGGGRRASAASRPTRARKARSTRKPMSAAQKRAVSLRMKRYWADRRKAEAGKGKKR